MRRPALALLLGCLLLVAGVSALDGYDYYQTIEYAGCDQDVYQQDIVIHRTTGTAYNETAGGLETWHIFVGDHCQADYDDVRFTNSTGAELAYYLWPGYDSSSARFCVRLEGADAAGTLAIHYGNPAAVTASDASKVYPLFDHFDGGALDTGLWSTSGAGSAGVADSVLTLLAGTGSDRIVVSNDRYIGPYTLEMRAKSAHYGRTSYFESLGVRDVAIKGAITAIPCHSESQYAGLFWNWDTDDSRGTTSIQGWAANTWHRLTLHATGSTAIWHVDSANQKTLSTAYPKGVSLPINLLTRWTGASISVDWVLVRAYSATPPAATTFSGEQETAAVLQPFPGLANIPRDLAGNGLYTDINGNNRLDYNDLTVFFQHLAWAKTAQPIACFDFNSNGWLDYNDVITLFTTITGEHP